MNYWIDVENGEYGMVGDLTDLPGMGVGGLDVLDADQTRWTATRAREVGGVLVIEGLGTFLAVFGALESALAMSFIHSPVAPTCAPPCGFVETGGGFRRLRQNLTRRKRVWRSKNERCNQQQSKRKQTGHA